MAPIPDSVQRWSLKWYIVLAVEFVQDKNFNVQQNEDLSEAVPSATVRDTLLNFRVDHRG